MIRQPGVIERHRVAGSQNAVEWPGPLRHIRRPAFILGRDGVADSQPHLLADGRQHVDIGDVGIAGIDVVLVGVVYGAEQVLEGHGDAHNAMVLEHRQVDDGVAGSGEGGGEETAHAAIDGEVGFVTGGIVADVADAILAGGDGETGALEVGVEAVPDDDIGARNAGLLEAFADGIDEHGAGGIAAAGEAVDFQADHFGGAGDALPGCDGGIGVVERLDGAVEDGEETGGIGGGGAGGAKGGVAGDDDSRFCGDGGGGGERGG